MQISHRTSPRRPFAAIALGIIGSLTLSAGITAFGPDQDQALAVGSTNSSLTVKWAGDDGLAASFQPERKKDSVHYGDFEKVTATVAQTRELTDQRIRVSITGMPGPTQGQAGGGKLIATNFVQAMQCWGDPESEDFRETCQWGGHLVNGGYVSRNIMDGNAHRSWSDKEHPMPFHAVWGEKFSGKSNPLGTLGVAYNKIFTADNSNEILAAPMGAGGKGWFDFETQTSNAAPHLGCGAPKGEGGAGERCWLVLVPRGEHHSETDSFSTKDRTCRNGYGDKVSDPRAQVGSPINPVCDYWDNRIVVPLDFQATGATCPLGSAERPVAGAQLMTAAVSSWQPALCADGGATFSFAALSDAVARDQLLTGQSRFALTGRPLSESTVSTDLGEQLGTAEIAYAPMAISAPVFAVLASTRSEGKIELPIKLTPRLVAKLLTQTYPKSIPSVNGYLDYPEYALRLYEESKQSLLEDPEFQAINPDWSQYTSFLSNSTEPGLLIVPTASDANAQLWRWLQSDEKARAFLNGEPDNILPGDLGNFGLKINPNYLPKGHPDASVLDYIEEEQPGYGGTINKALVAKPGGSRLKTGLAMDDGTPYSLADTPLDTVPRADPWVAPRILYSGVRSRIDTTQWNPPRSSFGEIAADIARDSRKSKAEWDPVVENAARVPGDWVNKPAAYAGSLMMGVTSTNNAELFALDSASLQLPNQPGNYSSPDSAAMTAALDAATESETAGVAAIDPAKVTDGAYPLTQIVWGAMRLDGSTAEERNDYANFIEYATTKGQEPGMSAGQLPVGYAPLTPELKAQAAAAVAKIRAYVPPAEGGNDGLGDDGATPGGGMKPNTTPPNGLGGNTPGGSIDNDTLTPANQPTAQLGNTPEEASGTHTAAPVGVFSVLGGTLLLGLSGAAASPALLRRRDTAPL